MISLAEPLSPLVNEPRCVCMGSTSGAPTNPATTDEDRRRAYPLPLRQIYQRGPLRVCVPLPSSHHALVSSPPILHDHSLSSQTESLDCKDSHVAPVFSTTRTVTSATLLHHGHPRGHLPPGGIGPPPEAVQQALRRLSSLRAFRIYRALDTPSSQPMPQQPFRGAQSWHHTTARDGCNPRSSIASHLGASEIRPIPSDPAPRPSPPVQLVSHERGSHP